MGTSPGVVRWGGRVVGASVVGSGGGTVALVWLNTAALTMKRRAVNMMPV